MNSARKQGHLLEREMALFSTFFIAQMKVMITAILRIELLPSRFVRRFGSNIIGVTHNSDLT
jgi:hypothetical protein